MFVFGVGLAAVALPAATAQSQNYTVWSSVVFSRTGERTPEILGYTTPTVLTSLGAQQQYASGQYLRHRYLESYGSIDGVGSAPIQGLSVNNIEVEDVYVAAVDEQFNAASAQAFLQGLYPPYSLASNDTIIDKLLDPTSMLANKYLPAPLGGYQYAQIHSFDVYDPEYVYLGGSIECPAWDLAAADYTLTSQFDAIYKSSRDIYMRVGADMMSDVLPNADEWSYLNAYAIYDYLSYQNIHNSTFNAWLSGGDSQYVFLATNTSYLDILGRLASEQQFAQLGNKLAQNDLSSSSWPSGVRGSISTLPGNLLAAKMLGQLQEAVYKPDEAYKLSLLFGDYQPLMSLFSLLDLTRLNFNFEELPSFGSVAVFELFSYTDTSSPATMPSEDDLWVRFWFRNGTGSSEPYQSYSLFNNGPDTQNMKWTDFEQTMYEISIGEVGIWCNQCQAEMLFCSAWNSSDAVTGISQAGSSSGHYSALSPVVNGVIGAIVALVLAGMVFAALMLLGGVRLHRVKSHKNELGGFKGGQKMASDRDLTITKGGVIVGATVETPHGHERVGSWELKQNEAGMPNIAATYPARRPSFEADEIGDVGAAPYRKPTEADEGV